MSEMLKYPMKEHCESCDCTKYCKAKENFDRNGNCLTDNGVLDVCIFNEAFIRAERIGGINSVFFMNFAFTNLKETIKKWQNLQIKDNVKRLMADLLVKYDVWCKKHYRLDGVEDILEQGDEGLLEMFLAILHSGESPDQQARRIPRPNL